MTSDTHVVQSGHLDVGDGHQIYWEDWGNPTAKPIFHLHGGPGGSFDENHKVIYNPEIHRVIFHDQRGCGQSTPFGETEHNTIQLLIQDIEMLRTHLGIESAYISGGSWGSTLALCYALAHPARVQGLMIWSVFLARQSEIDFINEGYPRYFFPNEWKRFIDMVPEVHRGNGDATMRYYADKIRDPDPATARAYANEWTLWERTLTSITYNAAQYEKEVFSDPQTEALAKLETHYFIHNCFVPEGYILNSLAGIKHIPCWVAHGHFDMCTPGSTSADLAAAYGDKLTLTWTNSGHLRTDPDMLATLQKTAATHLT